MRRPGATRTTTLIVAVALAGCVAPVARERPAPPPPFPVPAPAPITAPRPLATLIALAPDLSRFRALAAVGGLDRLTMERRTTVFAPTDAAFARLPAGTVEALLQRGNRPSLLHLMRFWVVAGIASLPTPGDAPVSLVTLDGEPLSAAPDAGTTVLTDGDGRRGYVVRRTAASDGELVELNGIVAPRSIEPGAGPP